MRIRTQFIISTIIFCGVLLLMAVSVVITSERVRKAVLDQEIAGKVERDAYDLGYLTNDYLLYREPQQLRRWWTKFSSFSTNLVRLSPETPEQVELVANIEAQRQRFEDVFTEVLAATGTAKSQGNWLDESVRVSWSRMQVQNQGMIFDASRLARLSREEATRLAAAKTTLAYTMLGVLGAFLLASYAITHRRVLRSISELQAGTRIVGSGNLDYAIEVKRNDEIGELSAAFNTMTASLKELTASRSLFQEEIAVRKRAEDALRAGEQKLRVAMEAAEMGTWVYTFADSVCEYDQYAQKLYGLQSPRLVHDEQGAKKIIYADDLPAMWRAVRAACDPAGSGRYHVEYRTYQLDGSLRWLSVWGQTEFEGEGAARRPVRIVGASRDISSQKRADEALARAKEAAEHASRAKDQFIAVLSHELRTPLMPAMAALSVIQADKRLPADMREDVTMVSRNIALEVRLIADLLDVSRIVSGKLHLEMRTVDVAVSIREAAAIVSGDLDAHNQSLTIETPGAPYLVRGDAARLQQVFWNLLRNAIKFSPERGHIKVRAAIEPVAAGTNNACLDEGTCPSRPSPRTSSCWRDLVVEVIDHGCGISPETLPRLFRAFEQEANGRRFGGLGLGLSICKAVVEMHGGTISVHSDGPGRGATFKVRLRVAQCPVFRSPSNLPACGTEYRDEKPTAMGSYRILLVEDHVDTATLMRRLLTADGHKVTTVGSVADGLQAVREGAFDLMISDLGLPDGSGVDLMQRLCETGRRLPAIALSGYGSAEDIARSKDVGFMEHLVKPLDSLDTLRAAIIRLGIQQNVYK